MRPHFLIILSLFLFSFCGTSAQKIWKIDSVYNNALNLYQQKNIDKAKVEFEKVLALNSKHKDATFNLAVINYELGNKDKAIGLFQACVKLKDRNAAAVLKQQLGQTIAYSDTMHLDDVTTSPKVIVNSKQEEIIINKDLNKVLANQIANGLRKSKVLKKEVGFREGKKIFLSLFFGKDGKLGAEVLSQNKNQIVQEEIASILQKISIIPGKYEDKEVVTWGITVPFQL